MNKLIYIILLLVSFNGFSQDVFGKWTVIDEEDNKAKLIVNIYKKEGKVFGKIIEILDKSTGTPLCEKCSGSDYNKPVIGLDMIKDMDYSQSYYKNGTIVDPRSGKIYKSRMLLTEDNPDILQVRGYIAFFYKTQYWERVK